MSCHTVDTRCDVSRCRECRLEVSAGWQRSLSLATDARAVIEPAAATRVIDGIEFPAVGTWLIDPDLTTISFRVRHLMQFPLHGSFSSVSGLVAIADDPADSTVDVEIATSTASIGAGGHDERLRSTEHLDVEHHPTAVFRSRRVRWRGTHA